MVAVVMIWPALAWLVMRFAVCTAEPKMSRFSSTTGPKLQPMRMATVLLVDLERGMQGDLLLHLRGGVQRIVGRREGRHDLIAHGLDDGAAVLLGGRAHHLDADADHVAGAQIAQQFIQLGAADHVGKHDREFDSLPMARRIILNLASGALQAVVQAAIPLLRSGSAENSVSGRRVGPAGDLGQEAAPGARSLAARPSGRACGA